LNCLICEEKKETWANPILRTEDGMNYAVQGQKPHRGDNVYSLGDEVEKSRVAAATWMINLVAGANAPPFYCLIYVL